jgi:hypothetical protein
MITAVIGRQFLAAYNAAHGLRLSVTEYFEERFIPLFFDHPKYVMHGGNSRLSNPPFKKGQYPEAPERSRRIGEWLAFMQRDPAGSSPVGFPSTDLLATTSGQVSGALMPITSEEAMLSWVGGALGVGVQGALSLLIPVDAVLLAIEAGWHRYRQLLTDQPELRPNQVNTWNGQWLGHYTTALGDPATTVMPTDTFSVDKGIMSVETAPWPAVLLALGKILPADARTLTVYVYNLGQTNTTVGFVPVDLSGIRGLGALYRKLFGESEYNTNRAYIDATLGSGFGFRRACQAGAIGIYALQPKGLRGIMPQAGAGKENKLPTWKKDDQTLRVQFHIYQTWLLAMLDKPDLWEESEKAARLLLAYESGAGKLKANRSNDVLAVLKAATKHQFLQALEPIIRASESPAEAVALARSIHYLPEDNIKYYITLIRLRYAELDR